MQILHIVSCQLIIAFVRIPIFVFFLLTGKVIINYFSVHLIPKFIIYFIFWLKLLKVSASNIKTVYCKIPTEKQNYCSDVYFYLQAKTPLLP